MSVDHAPGQGILRDDERARVQSAFGVGPEQVVRDHLISHVLAALASSVPDAVVFFGGTALARTHLPSLRLSEDIDLIAIGPRAEVGERIERAITLALRRSFGEVGFVPSFSRTRGAQPVVLVVGEVSVQVQLLDAVGYPRWPTERVDLVQRYSDAPPARLDVPTLPSFVAAKVSAWADRAAPRDLYDLWALHERGAFVPEAARLFATVGPGGAPTARTFEYAPTDAAWHRALAHQGRVGVDPQTALEVVRNAWISLA